MAGDFTEPSTLDSAFPGAEAVLLVCGHHPEQLALERGAVAAAAAAGVRRLVYVSAAGVDTSSVPALALDHAALEQELAASGMTWSVLRPTAVYASLVGGLARLIGADGTLPLAFGPSRVNLVDAADVGAAAATVLLDESHQGCVHTLTGPHAFTGDELVTAIAHAAGRPLRHQDMTLLRSSPTG